MPDKNKCWFANRVFEIKTKYSLSVDTAEVEVLEQIISQCESVYMIFFNDSTSGETIINEPISESVTEGALGLYDDNNNGRITCAEARSHGIDPVYKFHPAYAFMRDSNNDGVVCE